RMKTELVTNRFEIVNCQACGRRVARKSRQQRYCGDRCRQHALRENKAVTNPHFLSNKNNELRGAKSGSSIPLNVLGGYRWPGAAPIEPEVLRKVVRAEIRTRTAPRTDSSMRSFREAAE